MFDLANGEDVRDSTQLNAAIERLPRLDVLVCAAGVGGESLHTDEVVDEEWKRVHAINLDGVFYANRAAIPKMRAGGYGRIVNVASMRSSSGSRRRSSRQASPQPRASRTRPRPACCCVNSQTAGAKVHTPFGGIKSSGFGPHEQGRAAIEFSTETVTVYVDP